MVQLLDGALIKHITGYFYCKTKLRLRVSDKQGNLAFAQESFYLQGIFMYIKEKDTLSLENTTTCWKTELHLTHVVSYGLIAGQMFQIYHTWCAINSFFYRWYWSFNYCGIISN